MNSIWNKNLEFFKNRFPALYQRLSDSIKAFSPGEYWVEKAKNGELTATFNNTRLHSSYNPSREAESTLNKAVLENTENLIFFGAGLGYNLLSASKIFPGKTLVYIEKSVSRFLEMLWHTDLQALFSMEKCIIAVEADPQEISPVFTPCTYENTVLFENPAFISGEKDYFDAIKASIRSCQNRHQINENTKKKFGKLWIRNGLKNLDKNQELSGVCIYLNGAENLNLPFLVIAAGPSLETVLPRIKELKEKAVCVCVDTALSALLKAGVEPDFIVLTDPQYWAYRHISGLSSPSSVLITESSVYPSVFRFNCRKTVLCSSLFPWGQYFENIFGAKGTLGSGGSVASSAFNFCVLAGAREILFAGMDLSFTKNQTHIKGSTFEQAVFTSNRKNKTGESATCGTVFSADISIKSDYNGNPVLTDSRMKMFAWWFEKRIDELRLNKNNASNKNTISIKTITPQSMVVGGIEKSSAEEFLSSHKDTAQLKKQFFACEKREAASIWNKELFQKEKERFYKLIEKKDESIKEILEYTNLL